MEKHTKQLSIPYELKTNILPELSMSNFIGFLKGIVDCEIRDVELHNAVLVDNELEITMRYSPDSEVSKGNIAVNAADIQ